MHHSLPTGQRLLYIYTMVILMTGGIAEALISYRPTYSLKNLLDDLDRYGLQAPPCRLIQKGDEPQKHRAPEP